MRNEIKLSNEILLEAIKDGLSDILNDPKQINKLKRIGLNIEADDGVKTINIQITGNETKNKEYESFSTDDIIKIVFDKEWWNEKFF